MRVVVGSSNPVKQAAVKKAFCAVFPTDEVEIVCFSAPSGVADQPFGHIETKTGAINRAEACRKAHPEADFFVGLEGGLVAEGDDFWSYAWMCVIDNSGKVGLGSTGGFLLPPAISKRVRAGEELGVAADMIFTEHNSKQQGGTVGLLTNGLITRADYYVPALQFALIPFIQTELYSA